jgi:AAA+ ATPase superfamily predicted ATPase
MDPFIDRQQEMRVLDELYQWPKKVGTLGVVSGRRRVGKTALLTNWLRQNEDVRGFYWVADQGTTQDQLAAFSQNLVSFREGRGVERGFSYQSWFDAFLAMGAMAEDTDRLVVLVDEFSNLLSSDPGVSSQLQRAWDQELQHRNLMLVLSGSFLGLMQEHVLAPTAPLYGRAQRLIDMRPFSYGHTKAFFADLEADQRLALYAIWGGIPGYWQRLDPGAKPFLYSNMVADLLTQNSAMHSEPRLLIHDHVQDPGRYVSILRAISRGHRSVTAISEAVGVPATGLTPYLSRLQESGLIQRQIPVTARPGSKSGRYGLLDPYLRFYYRFIEPGMGEIAMGLNEQVFVEISQHLADFIGAYTWKEVCREWTLRAGARGRLPFPAGRVGSVWNRRAQVDIMGLDRGENNIVLGACTWTQPPERFSVLEKLLTQADEVIPKERNWRVYVIGISRAGWNSEASREVERLDRDGYADQAKNWELIGAELLSLEQIDSDLVTWAAEPLPDAEVAF